MFEEIEKADKKHKERKETVAEKSRLLRSTETLDEIGHEVCEAPMLTVCVVNSSSSPDAASCPVDCLLTAVQRGLRAILYGAAVGLSLKCQPDGSVFCGQLPKAIRCARDPCQAARHVAPTCLCSLALAASEPCVVGSGHSLVFLSRMRSFVPTAFSSHSFSVVNSSSLPFLLEIDKKPTHKTEAANNKTSNIQI
ncbi:unnamed protein product [Rangifer tarandus platyrhynchus]|uniref:Uncharacterized protein n=1 Tax=Rangifer tarandus platyrhynchus TaxID=3082113 RepID=A0ABN8YQR1_RANTA|nr:unnamed protein product [Rangifer tarandus platyrhynchus]